MKARIRLDDRQSTFRGPARIEEMSGNGQGEDCEIRIPLRRRFEAADRQFVMRGLASPAMCKIGRLTHIEAMRSKRRESAWGFLPEFLGLRMGNILNGLWSHASLASDESYFSGRSSIHQAIERNTGLPRSDPRWARRKRKLAHTSLVYLN